MAASVIPSPHSTKKNFRGPQAHLTFSTTLLSLMLISTRLQFKARGPHSPEQRTWGPPGKANRATPRRAPTYPVCNSDRIPTTCRSSQHEVAGEDSPRASSGLPHLYYPVGTIMGKFHLTHGTFVHRAPRPIRPFSLRSDRTVSGGWMVLGCRHRTSDTVTAAAFMHAG